MPYSRSPSTAHLDGPRRRPFRHLRGRRLRHRAPDAPALSHPLAHGEGLARLRWSWPTRPCPPHRVTLIRHRPGRHPAFFARLTGRFGTPVGTPPPTSGDVTTPAMLRHVDALDLTGPAAADFSIVNTTARPLSARRPRRAPGLRAAPTTPSRDRRLAVHRPRRLPHTVDCGPLPVADVAVQPRTGTPGWWHGS